MTTEVDVVNRALQSIGTRTTITTLSEQSNEAIQASLIIDPLRDSLLRMAPWDCGMNYASLTYITSSPGTPENTSAGNVLWAKGQPPPPWIYEYQYPADCFKALFIVPQLATGFASGVPITSAVTGSVPQLWTGPPAKFKVALDQFYVAVAAAVVAGGTGYAIGDYITLAGTVAGSVPIGAPAVLQVATVAAGVILTVSVVPSVINEVASGSYFTRPANPVAQGSTTGSGSGATFNLTLAGPGDQRVILTDQEFAILAYIKKVTDPNVMDPLFIDAWALVLGARLSIGLTGDKALANLKIAEANERIMEARKADGNEGTTINDVMPDFIRIRGIYSNDGWNGGVFNYDWGGLWPMY